jgi:hypothetical protein
VRPSPPHFRSCRREHARIPHFHSCRREHARIPHFRSCRREHARIPHFRSCHGGHTRIPHFHSRHGTQFRTSAAAQSAPQVSTRHCIMPMHPHPSALPRAPHPVYMPQGPATSPRSRWLQHEQHHHGPYSIGCRSSLRVLPMSHGRTVFCGPLQAPMVMGACGNCKVPPSGPYILGDSTAGPLVSLDRSYPSGNHKLEAGTSSSLQLPTRGPHPPASTSVLCPCPYHSFKANNPWVLCASRHHNLKGGVMSGDPLWTSLLPSVSLSSIPFPYPLSLAAPPPSCLSPLWIHTHIPSQLSCLCHCLCSYTVCR